MELKLFPWENDVKPYFVNEEGFEWYLDNETNSWIRRDLANGVKGIKNIVCFFVRKGDTLTRILIGENQKVIYEHTNWESMLAYIDILKVANDIDGKK